MRLLPRWRRCFGSADQHCSRLSYCCYGNLECGHTYYWRVKARECATTQVIRSPWSEVRSFTVKAGLPVVSPYFGLQLLAPNNGCLGCPVKPVSFSWSPFKETTKYKFQLATDAGMTQIVKEAESRLPPPTSTMARWTYSTNYFWRVMSVEPAPSDWSATFSFQTEAKPAAAAGNSTSSSNSNMGLGCYRYRRYTGHRHPGTHLQDAPGVILTCLR